MHTRTYHSTWRYLTLACALALLVACSSPAPQPTPPMQPAPSATPVDTPAVAAPTAAPTMAAPTEPPPTTEVPPTAAPTLPPPPTSEPTAIPPTEAPASAPVAAEGACYGPYTPIREGAVWRYQTDGPADEPTRYTISYQDVSADGFTAVTAFEEVSVETRWRCTETGAQPAEFAQMNLLGQVEGLASIEFETVESRGVSWPLPEQWQVGHAWSYGHTVVGTMSTEAGAIEVTMEIDMANRLAAEESVTVPAGTYPQAMRVETDATMHTSSKMGSMELPTQTIQTTMTTWYVENVGMVRQVYSSPAGETTVELVDAP